MVVNVKALYIYKIEMKNLMEGESLLKRSKKDMTQNVSMMTIFLPE
jgi:hypothetical protein